MDTFWQDLKYGARMLLKNRSITAIAVLTLALGIGANTAIFSFVNGILLHPLPFREPDRLLALWETNPEKVGNYQIASTRNVEDWARASSTIEQFGVWRDRGMTMKGPEGAEPLYGAIASPEFFQVLRAQAEQGRLFSPDENQQGKDHVVVLSDTLWRRRFGADRGILGQPLTLNGEVFTVIGVLPTDFNAPSFDGVDIWAPHSIDEDLRQGRWLRNRQVVARLKPGATLEQARAEMNTIAQQLASAYPDTNGGWGIAVSPYQEHEVGSVRPAFLIFSGAVGFVLLIACANVANLLLARAAARKKEFAIRAALGAGRVRVLRQMLTESVLLALFAGALGCLLAFWAVDLFVALSPSVPRLEQVRVDRTALIFTLVLSALAGILFGLAPAVHAAKKDLTESLKEGTRTGGSAPGMSLRSVLVSTETALALVLLIGAGLLIQSFVRMMAFQPGYDPNNILTFEVYPGLKRYPKAEQVTAVYEQIAENLKTIPGVRAVANVSSGPLFGATAEGVEFQVAGQALPETGKNPTANYHNTSPGYFRTMGIPLRQGRDFDERDTAGAPAVAIINETMARRWWPGTSPIGHSLRLVRGGDSVEIIGVAGDVRRPALNATVEPEIFWPYRQRTRWASYFVLRASVPPESLVSAVRSHVAQLDREILVSNVRTMDQRLARSARWPRFLATLLGIFSGVALLLAVVGVYGVISYAVAQRTHEIGIRMALGAQKFDVLKLILRRGLALTLTGVGIGLGAALGLARYLEGLLFDVRARDPYIFAGVAALLAVVALVACYIPAQRATRVDPMVALRYE